MTVVSPAHVITIGGLDPSGGAGVIRDHATARALQASAHVVVTALTEQGSGGVNHVEPRAPAALAASIAAALAAAPKQGSAVKVGMVASGALLATIVDGLEGFDGPIIFDPVMRASRGGALFEHLDLASWRTWAPLCTRVTLVTANLEEAQVFAGQAIAKPEESVQAGETLVERGVRAVLIKGGHLAGDAVDVLVTAQGARMFCAARVPGASPRGTGCSLATAIAVAMARGSLLDDAVAHAKAWLHGRIKDAVAVRNEWHLPR